MLFVDPSYLINTLLPFHYKCQAAFAFDGLVLLEEWDLTEAIFSWSHSILLSRILTR
eukprot:SAG31_NODE_2075_length_6509_cov_2.710764_4_plen_57_part_00